MWPVLLFWIFLNLYLFFVSVRHIRNSPQKFEFIYSWAFIIGAFVWEDLLVFSLFQVLCGTITLLTNDFRLFILLFVVFWIVRSSGEALYMFLEQFIVPKNYPHYISSHFAPFRRFFGPVSDQKCFILLQVFQQTLLVFSLTALVLLLLYWPVLGQLRVY
jgi:hypothetical protein